MQYYSDNKNTKHKTVDNYYLIYFKEVLFMVTKVQKFGIKDNLGYMFGDFGNDFTFILSLCGRIVVVR